MFMSEILNLCVFGIQTLMCNFRKPTLQFGFQKHWGERGQIQPKAFTSFQSKVLGDEDVCYGKRVSC